MNKVAVPLRLTVFALALFFVTGCFGSFLGLEKYDSDRAVLNLNLQYPEMTAAGSRAIIGSDSYLYIRTFGGPVGEKGPLYGPYSINGSEFSTTDVPTGEFSDMLVINTTLELDTYFAEMMAMSDAELLSNLQATVGVSSPLYSLLDGYGSAGMTGKQSVVPGKNTVRLTLVPFCGYGSTLSLVEYTPSSFQANSSISQATGINTRRFLKLDLGTIPEYWEGLNLSVTSPTYDVQLALFDANGKSLGSFSFNPVSYQFTKVLSEIYPVLYLYFEAAGTSSILVSAAPGTTLSSVAEITAFSLSGVSGVIDQSTHTISVTLPSGSDVASLSPTISYTGVSISPDPSELRDFSNGMTYTVIAEDGKVQNYSVSVTVLLPPIMVITGKLTPADNLPVTRTSGETINFGALIGGSTEITMTYTLTNNGETTLSIDSLNITGTNTDYFNYALPSQAVPPGESITLTLQFVLPAGWTSADWGNKAAQLQIDSNDSVNPTFLLNLTGYCS